MCDFYADPPVDPTHFYSSHACLKMGFYSTGSSYGPGTATKTLNTGAKTKTRIIYHLYHDGNANDDAIRVTVGGVIKKLGLYRCLKTSGSA